VYGCCKNSQIFLKKWSSLTFGVPWKTLFNVWPYQGRRYLTSDGLWQTLNCSSFSLILARKLTFVLLAPTLDNIGPLKDRRQVTSAIFPTLFWRHLIRRRCLGRRQRSKMSDVKRLFCVSVIIILTIQENISLITNFSDKKLLVTILTNLYINLQNKKLLVIKIVIIMNKKL